MRDWIEDVFGPPSVLWALYAAIIAAGVGIAFSVTGDAVGQLAIVGAAGLLVGMLAGLAKARREGR